MASIFQKGWDALGSANSGWKDKTQPITGQTLPEGVSQPLWNVHAILYSLNEKAF